MATDFTAPEIEAPYDSFSVGNRVKRYGLIGATTGTAAIDVRAAVTAAQIYCKGTISVSAACIVTLISKTTGTVIATLEFLAGKLTEQIKTCATIAGEALQIKSDTDVTLGGNLITLPVSAGFPVPPDWALQQ